MAPRPPVLLLDLDDTIVSFSAGKPDLWLDAYARHGAGLPISGERFAAAVAEVVPGYWGDAARAHRGRLDLVRARREVVGLAFERLGLCARDRIDAIADHYTEDKEQRVAPFPGAVEALHALRARGVRLGLVTNGSSSFQRRKLARFDLEPLFEAVAIEGEVGIGKPNAAPFQHVLERMGVRATEAWMVGDNLSADIAGAQALGIGTVWNDHARSGLPADPPARPDHIVHHIDQVLRLIAP